MPCPRAHGGCHLGLLHPLPMARPHEPPPSTDNHTTGWPRPWDMGCNLVGLAEELDGRDGRTPGGPPPWTTSFLMAAWRLTPTLCPSPPPGLGRSRRSESSVGRDLGRVIPALSSFPIGLSSGMTSSVRLVFKDHLSMPSCCQAACGSSPPHEDTRSTDSWIPPAYKAAAGRDPQDQDDEG